MKTYYYVDINETRQELPSYDVLETVATHLSLSVRRTTNPAEEVKEGAVYKTRAEAVKAAQFLRRAFIRHAACYDTCEIVS